ncbi:hypothetical protein [Chondromyces apiculatus]|uniref:hypothetical protein n=1 Tax=Chondromyces apiculatus TaxID=51 RepID=UPI0006931F7C|nr:hypothetical protein [Chondromyces apiculatus]
MIDRADPLVLLVGCSEGLVAMWREAGGRLSVAVQEWEPGTLRTGALRRPFAVVVMDDRYRAEPTAFDALTREGPTSLVRLEDGDLIRQEDQQLLAEAVLQAAYEMTAPGATASLPG